MPCPFTHQVTTELLMSGADTPVSKFFINCLAEEPTDVRACVYFMLCTCLMHACEFCTTYRGGGYRGEEPAV